jgi:tripartite-type tricarboxylate transporter receptor subunit TctC
MLINVLNHTLDIGVGELQEIRAQLEIGRLRLLGVVGEARLPQFPDVPTVREQGIDVAVRKFRGFAGPKGMSPEIIAAWEAAVPKLLEDPVYRKLYTDNSLQPGFMPHEEYVAFMRDFGGLTQTFLKQSGVIR